MNKNEIIQFYIDKWNNRKPSGMSHNQADWDERAFDWVKELTEDEDRKIRSARRVSETAKYLRRHGLLNSENVVIDIGCGPGRFVTEFAKTSKFVTGTDISPNMCRFGMEYAQSENITNVEFIPCDFKETDIGEMGWEKKFDLVFSSITPAMSTYDSFKKAESMSKAWCFQSNFIKVVDPLGDEVISEVVGNDTGIPKRDIGNMLPMVNIICGEGCLPMIELYKETGHDHVPVDDHIVNQILKNTSLKKEEKETIKDDVKAVLLKHADISGCVNRHMEWIYAWVLWDVRQKSAR